MIKEALKLFGRCIILVIVIVSVAALFHKNADANLHHEDYKEFDFQITMTSHKIPPIIYTVPQTPEELSENNLYTEKSHPDEYCIALNVYYESRADNLAGKYSVADVVLNRVQDSRFPTTACNVIREGIMYESWSTKQHKDLYEEERIYWPKLNRCQFSWFCDGVSDIPTNQAAWRDAQIIAYNIVQFGTFRGITEGATHYHATYVRPNWSLVYQLIGRIGQHIFYKWL